MLLLLTKPKGQRTAPAPQHFRANSVSPFNEGLGRFSIAAATEFFDFPTVRFAQPAYSILAGTARISFGARSRELLGKLVKAVA
jgi:hypothetical protein